MKSGSPEYVKCVLADKGVSYMFKVVNTGEVGSLAKQWKAQGWTEVVVSRCGDRLRSVVGYRNEILGPSPLLVACYNHLAAGGFTPEKISELIALHEDRPDEYLKSIERREGVT